MAFHEVPARAQVLACDDCGCVVDPTDRGRTAHEQWHESLRAAAPVIDLPAAEGEELRRVG